MTVPEIIEALTSDVGKFPRAAMEAATAQREEVTPHLLRCLEEAGENPGKLIQRGYVLHIFAIHLLAQFRECRAYPLLVQLLLGLGDKADDAFGDTITEGLARILASLYDGNPGPLKTLVENEQVYEFARGAAVEAFVVLSCTGQVPRETVVDYFRELFQDKLPREHQHVWNDLACAVADLPAPELLPQLEKAYDEGLIDPSIADFDGLKRDALVPAGRKSLGPRYELLHDAIKEMETWVTFEPDQPRSRPARGVKPLLQQEYPNPSSALRAGPKIGRNDPCPCGSGKKYKKCCL